MVHTVGVALGQAHGIRIYYIPKLHVCHFDIHRKIVNPLLHTLRNKSLIWCIFYQGIYTFCLVVVALVQRSIRYFPGDKGADTYHFAYFYSSVLVYKARILEPLFFKDGVKFFPAYNVEIGLAVNFFIGQLCFKGGRERYGVVVKIKDGEFLCF